MSEAYKRSHDDATPTTTRVKKSRFDQGPEDVSGPSSTTKPAFGSNYAPPPRTGSAGPEADRPRDLIITSLPFTATEGEILSVLGPYGDVDFVEHKMDFETGKRRGYGFIRFKSLDAQKQVLDRRDFVIGGRAVQVKIPYDRKTQTHQTSFGNVDASSMPQNSKKLFVGRVSHEMTEAQIAQAFSAEAKKINEFAEVTDVYIPQPFKGYAFITLNSHVIAQKLLQKKNFTIDGQPVFVNPAVQKNQETREAERVQRERANNSTADDYSSYETPASTQPIDPALAARVGEVAQKVYGDSPYAAVIAQFSKKMAPTHKQAEAQPTADYYSNGYASYYGQYYGGAYGYDYSQAQYGAYPYNAYDPSQYPPQYDQPPDPASIPVPPEQGSSAPVPPPDGAKPTTTSS